MGHFFWSVFLVTLFCGSSLGQTLDEQKAKRIDLPEERSERYRELVPKKKIPKRYKKIEKMDRRLKKEGTPLYSIDPPKESPRQKKRKTLQADPIDEVLKPRPKTAPKNP